MFFLHSEVRRRTKRSGGLVWTGGLALAIGIIGAGEGALAKSPTALERWTPLDPPALDALYAGKTWQWKRGAAYFSPDGRFMAWSREGGKKTEGRGAWDLRGDGVMCFTATWAPIPAQAGQGPSPPVETCFGHEKRGSAIAQMKLPNGPWYFFRRSPPGKTDEVFKLRKGDRTHLSG